MTCQAAIYPLLIIGHNAENQQSREKTEYTDPPAQQKSKAQAHQKAREKDADAHPPIVIASLIKLIYTSLQALELPFNGISSFLLCNHKHSLI